MSKSRKEARFWMILFVVLFSINIVPFVVLGSPLNLLVALLNGWAAADAFATLRQNGARP